MKLIKIFYSEIDAKLAAGQLEANGIPSFINGSKEYTTHLLGGFRGRFEMQVEEEDLEQAQQILAQFERASFLSAVSSPIHEVEKTAATSAEMAASEIAAHKLMIDKSLQKALYLGILCIVIVFPPFVMNYFSLKNFLFYFKNTESSLLKYFWSSVIILINLAGLSALYILFKMLTG